MLASCKLLSVGGSIQRQRGDDPCTDALLTREFARFSLARSLAPSLLHSLNSHRSKVDADGELC